jgi:hypothetical protein
MTKPKPLESVGTLLNVQSKIVNNQTVIEVKTRMPFKASTFQKLGKMMEGSVEMTFDPSQLDAFPDATSDPPSEE